MVKKILFVCKYNRFRSKIAEAVFNKLNKNKNYQAKSAGIIKGSSIDKKQIETAKKRDIDIKGNPIGLSTKLLKWQDVTIIVADDVPIEIFKDNAKYGKELIIWGIPDAQEDNEEEINSIIQLIEKRVKELIEKLR